MVDQEALRLLNVPHGWSDRVICAREQHVNSYPFHLLVRFWNDRTPASDGCTWWSSTWPRDVPNGQIFASGRPEVCFLTSLPC